MNSAIPTTATFSAFSRSCSVQLRLLAMSCQPFVRNRHFSRASLSSARLQGTAGSFLSFAIPVRASTGYPGGCLQLLFHSCRHGSQFLVVLAAGPYLARSGFRSPSSMRCILFAHRPDGSSRSAQELLTAFIGLEMSSIPVTSSQGTAAIR